MTIRVTLPFCLTVVTTTRTHIATYNSTPFLNFHMAMKTFLARFKLVCIPQVPTTDLHNAQCNFKSYPYLLTLVPCKIHSLTQKIFILYQCWNCSVNKNCFACMTPSNPKFDKRLRNKSFSQRMIEKSDSTILVPGKSVATTPQYSIRFENRAPNKDQPSLKLELLESESMPSFNTSSHL